jgi:uncharacterized protein (TIGR02594 family)
MTTTNTILRRGSRGNDVRLLQSLLNQKVPQSRLPNGRRLVEDGDFGPKTEAAVRTFQQLNRLTVDGVVGPQTWKALGVQYTGPGSQPPAPTPVPPINVTGAPWMAVAQQEIGQSEIAGSQHNPRIIEYHSTTTLHASSDETAWCSSFVNWCLKQVSITGTNSAAAASWLNWGQSCAAKTGAITVAYDPQHPPTTSGNHVAFLVQETGAHYVLLGGNQSNQVRVSNYSKSRWQLKGYRWPR